MHLWDDSLRICPKCKAKCQSDDEPKMTCPECGSSVWFFNYRKLPEPPQIPTAAESTLWKNPTTTLLLVATVIFGLVALLAFWNTLIVSLFCSLAAVGFAIFGFIRHAEAINSDQILKHAGDLTQHSSTAQRRVEELTQRYIALLQTGNARIEHYHQQIFVEATKERLAAEKLLTQANNARQAVESVETRIEAMAARHVKDHLDWTASKLKADPESYQRQKDRLSKTFTFVESVGYVLPKGLAAKTLADLKASYQGKVREQQLKDEQRRIKAQIREEEKVHREREKAMRDAEAREKELADRLAEALGRQAGVHSAEVEDLQKQLAEAQSKSERAKSLAQLTKAGHVYILSNIGAFGERVFKIGMTRREFPHDRVDELGDASVPFPFDVHAMIFCNDAPKLENALHRELTKYRVNRVNLRKEFFELDLGKILKAVEKHHGKVEYFADAPASEYRDSQNITPEQLEELTKELAEMGVNLSEDDELDAAVVG